MEQQKMSNLVKFSDYQIVKADMGRIKGGKTVIDSIETGGHGWIDDQYCGNVVDVGYLYSDNTYAIEYVCAS